MRFARLVSARSVLGAGVLGIATSGVLALSCRAASKTETAAPVVERPAPVVLEIPSTPLLDTAEPSKPAVAPSAMAVVTPASGNTPASRKVRVYSIAALGDSITDFRTSGGGYLRVLEDRCPESKIANFGKGGDMVNQMRRRFEADILSAPVGTYTDLILFGGVNDLYSDETAGRTNAKITADMSFIYARAREAKMRVVAITVAPWGGFKRYFSPNRSEHTRSLNAWIFSQRGGLVDEVVDSYALLSCGDAERFCETYEFSRPDGLHFNKQGHDKLGAEVWARAFSDCR